jgi:hypothetical protein
MSEKSPVFGSDASNNKEKQSAREIFKQKWAENLRKVLLTPRPIDQGILPDDPNLLLANKFVLQIENLLYKSEKNKEVFAKIIFEVYGKKMPWTGFLIMDFIKEKYFEVYHEHYVDESWYTAEGEDEENPEV